MCEIVVSPIMITVFFLPEKILSSHTEAKEVQNILGIVSKKKSIYKSGTESSC